MSNWINVITFTLPQEAYIAKGRLESEGIPTIIKDELTTQVHNFYSNAIGGVKLLVNEIDFVKAREILVDGGFIVETEHEKIERLINGFNGKECPFCCSENIGLKKSPSIIMVLSFILTLFPFPIFRKTYHCFNCDKSWKKQI